MAKTRVVIVDDSALIRSLLSSIINREPDMEVVGTAADPYVAREVIRTLNPDVITLDVEMPRMDGIEFLSKLMRLRPMPVVMVSTLTDRGAEVTMKALELGAVDFVAKPKANEADGLNLLAREITEKVRTAARARVTKPSAATLARLAPSPAGATGTTKPTASAAGLGSAARDKIIFIGASTGGTEATREVLVDLPSDCPPILITQHMPPGFTKSYAGRLNNLCKITVKEAADGERVQAGHAYIAPGGLHMAIERAGGGFILRVRDGEAVNRHKPSVEVLFKSAAQVVGRNAVGVMLTGMGADGATAMREMRNAGAYCVAQDEASCVVFGMPREAINAGACQTILPVKQIGAHLVEHLRKPVLVRA